MSYSISNLFKAMAENPKQPEGKLYNPDLPESKSQSQDRQFIRDQAYNALKLGSQPRNGDFYLLPRTTFNNDPRKDSFLMERAIDPDVIRQKVNPISEAAPQMIEGGLYGIDKSMTQATDSVNLIRTSQEQFYNYSNRFSMMPDDQILSPMDKSNFISAGKPVIGYTPPRYTDSIQTLPAKTQGTGRGEGDKGI